MFQKLRGGEVWLFSRKKDVELHVESLSLHHIDAFFNKGRGDVQRFTGFYGASETQLQMDSQNFLRDSKIS